MKRHPHFMADAFLESEKKGLSREEKKRHANKAIDAGLNYWIKEVTECVNGFDMEDAPMIVAALKANLKALKRELPQKYYEQGIKLTKKINLTTDSKKVTHEDIVRMTKEEEKRQDQLF